MKKKEESLHLAVCNYLRLQYPDTIWSSEASGIRLTIGQAVKAKKLRSSDKLPDIWVLEPRGGSHGLILELKKETPYLKDGSLSQEKHIQQQFKILSRLSIKGYHATFVWSLDMAIDVINRYMK